MHADTTPAVPITHIEIDGLRTAQFVTGDDPEYPPVLMLHGWGANTGLVWPLASRLALLGYRVYAPDLPGFGESAPPPAAWDVHDYVRFVLAYMDYHQLERVHLFGHSFGGRIGLVLGAEHGDRILKMALADSAGIRPKSSPGAQIRLNTYKAIRDGLKRVGLGGLSEALRQWYNRRYGSADLQSSSGVMRETFLKVVNEDLRDYARQVVPSTLLLWGDQDADTPLSQGRLLEQIIPDAGLVIFEGAGHYSYLDRLADTVRVVDYFFRRPTH
jgi:pimeloyl-ACP methyl ester carboxylesterase